MSNPRLDDRLAVDGPGQADRSRLPAGVGPELLQRGLDHPVLTEVLRHLMERQAQTVGLPVAYYEDSP
ncbi:hypothetical protein SAMN04487981_101252 [Streptomyces sp. cf386]|uniref:hypothetical protein n=1 Tax=Streptomyces sp. cf386 TaxID=1761904 RepID=UPI0008924D33|nr:hypothetical protein [Streptomyces sp. cf386]SDM35599.1 hypothetical protein SAMN04487981_101252 [Streptomyces sp. cf386]